MESLHFEAEIVPVRTITLFELLECYFRYNKPEHRTKHGISRAFELLARFCPNLDTASFTKKTLYEFQDFLTGKFDRNYCNRLISFVRSAKGISLGGQKWYF